MDRLKILLVSNICPPDYDGGYELRAFQIANALRARGHDLDLVTSEYRATFKGERKDPDWVHRVFHYVLVSNSKTAWRYLDRIPKRIECTSVASENIPRMERFLQDRNYDLAYCFGLQRISLATVAPIVKRGIPILWHAGDGYIADHFHHWPKSLPGYELGLKLFANKWYSLEKRLDYRYVAFVSRFLRDGCNAKGFTPKKSYVISRGFDGPLGWDVNRPKSDPPLFFMACRIDPQKGIHHAIEAAGLLRKRRPELDWRLEIAGVAYSGYKEKLIAQANEFGIQDRVTFLGQVPRSEVLAKMRASAAFLSCSTYGEPFAGTIIETLASGTTLIGANAGSILEVATPDESALIYEIGDTATLSAHLEKVLVDPDAREKIALDGVNVIEQRYTLDRILDQTEETFLDVMNDHKEGHEHFVAAEDLNLV
jgi:glycogen synthase